MALAFGMSVGRARQAGQGGWTGSQKEFMQSVWPIIKNRLFVSFSEPIWKSMGCRTDTFFLSTTALSQKNNRAKLWAGRSPASQPANQLVSQAAPWVKIKGFFSSAFLGQRSNNVSGSVRRPWVNNIYRDSYSSRFTGWTWKKIVNGVQWRDGRILDRGKVRKVSNTLSCIQMKQGNMKKPTVFSRASSPFGSGMWFQ